MDINAQATITLRGGVVQEVFCNYAGVQITTIDLDDLDDQPDEAQQAKLDYAREQLDQVY